MTFVQKLSGEFTITDPDWPIYNIRTVLTSDSFNRTGALSGSQSDAALGGQPMPWNVSGPTGWILEDGGLRSPQTGVTDAAGFSGMPANCEVSLKIRSITGNAGGEYLVLSARSNENRSTRVAVNIAADGAGYFRELINGSEIQRQNITAGTVKAGDTIGLRSTGTKSTFMVNGVDLITLDVQINQAGWVGLTPFYGNRAFLLDDFKIITQ